MIKISVRIASPPRDSIRSFTFLTFFRVTQSLRVQFCQRFSECYNAKSGLIVDTVISMCRVLRFLREILIERTIDCSSTRFNNCIIICRRRKLESRRCLISSATSVKKIICDRYTILSNDSKKTRSTAFLQFTGGFSPTWPNLFVCRLPKLVFSQFICGSLTRSSAGICLVPFFCSSISGWADDRILGIFRLWEFVSPRF
jgi:hypothetical protein